MCGSQNDDAAWMNECIVIVSGLQTQYEHDTGKTKEDIFQN